VCVCVCMCGVCVCMVCACVRACVHAYVHMYIGYVCINQSIWGGGGISYTNLQALIVAPLLLLLLESFRLLRSAHGSKET
jgi:hypothetical protein